MFCSDLAALVCEEHMRARYCSRLPCGSTDRIYVQNEVNTVINCSINVTDDVNINRASQSCARTNDYIAYM